ncbi:hypothetical protein [Flavobacterium aestivum]|uniref:hypothetical protein n=1 Tax=Flavobacterium aestivum TaxID=3003257 RepID=UPI002286001F|nr:hypothetical protein [Flavobacterium aestivum]
MKNEPPFALDSYLKHCSGAIIKLERYGTQLVSSLHLCIDGQNIKKVPNYNFLYGIEVVTNKDFSGLTKEFKLIDL